MNGCQAAKGTTNWRLPARSNERSGRQLRAKANWFHSARRSWPLRRQLL